MLRLDPLFPEPRSAEGVGTLRLYERRLATEARRNRFRLHSCELNRRAAWHSWWTIGESQQVVAGNPELLGGPGQTFNGR